MVEERLRAWMNANKQRLPARILFYRDGVSESQFQDCINCEIPRIKKAHENLGGKDLKMTFVICGKRHHTRFYATNNQQTTNYFEKGSKGLSGNPRPGLLVDSVITNPEPANFFLQSHCAIKGTVRPAHYHVLEDGMGLYTNGAGVLPQVTNMLCYAFGRATKGVSYAAPAYIADRLCERGRVYLRDWNNNPRMEPQIERLMVGDKPEKDKQKILVHKNRFAKTLMEDRPVWGKNYNKDIPGTDGRKWENPWHTNLADGMLWM